ncbi:hypothetical protein NKG94_32310 [Micromonospora sp. M12]
MGAYGQLTGNAAPLQDQALVIERETGATYVFMRESCIRRSTTPRPA